MLKTIRTAFKLTKPRKFRAGLKYCPICESLKPIIRLNDNEIAIRCIACRASVVSMTMANVISEEYACLQEKTVYELSARGPLVRYLNRKCKNLTTSEFYPHVKLGDSYNGVLCQDVQNLTFESNSFDLATSTDVFEHVPNDVLGLKNIYRVLKPGGKAIFTVPLCGEITVQRAMCTDSGKIEHILPPEYHGDPIASTGKILAFRNYGYDLLDLLSSVGFKTSKIASPLSSIYWGIKRDIVVAQK